MAMIWPTQPSLVLGSLWSPPCQWHWPPSPPLVLVEILLPPVSSSPGSADLRRKTDQGRHWESLRHLLLPETSVGEARHNKEPRSHEQGGCCQPPWKTKPTGSNWNCSVSFSISMPSNILKHGNRTSSIAQKFSLPYYHLYYQYHSFCRDVFPTNIQ